MAGLRGDRRQPPIMLAFAKDLPNLCSLAGLLCALLGIYFAILHVYPAAMIGLLWAVLFDWCDGLIARRMKNRSDEQRAFGAQIDSLIDVVSFGVCPAVLLLSYGRFSPWFLPGAFAIIAAIVILCPGRRGSRHEEAGAGLRPGGTARQMPASAVRH